MLYDKMCAMLESAGKRKTELAELLNIRNQSIYYWLSHAAGNFPVFYKFCTFCGYKIKLKNRSNPTDVIDITKNDVEEDEWTQYEKRSPYKKTKRR